MHVRYLRGLGILVSALAVLVFALLPFRPIHANNERIITIYYDGVEQTVVTDAPTIGEVLKRADIPVDEKDLVEPGLKTQLSAPSYHVNIYRARPVTVVDGLKRSTVITPHTSAQMIAQDAGIALYQEDVAETSRIDDFLTENGVGLKLTVTRATPLTMVLYGKEQEVRTQKATVGELLQEKGITLGEQDGVSLSAETPIVAGMRVEVWRDGAQTVTVEEEIPFTTEFIRDTDKPVGYKEVKEAGVKGKKLVTYQIEMRNGQEVGRQQLQSVVVDQPQRQVEIVGGLKFGGNEEILYALRMCEAGGRYDRNSGNGFYGAYQFMISTWNRVAPKVGRPDLVGVRPDQASPADQDFMVIANAKLSSGGFATQHPGCYKKLGLPVKPY